MTEVYLCSECASGLEANQPVMKLRDSPCGWCGEVGVLVLYDAEREISIAISEDARADRVTVGKLGEDTVEEAVSEEVSESINVEVAKKLMVDVDPEHIEEAVKRTLEAENVTKTIDEQIAELQAKKAELEK